MLQLLPAWGLNFLLYVDYKDSIFWVRQLFSGLTKFWEWFTMISVAPFFNWKWDALFTLFNILYANLILFDWFSMGKRKYGKKGKMGDTKLNITELFIMSYNFYFQSFWVLYGFSKFAPTPTLQPLLIFLQHERFTWH